MSQPYNILTCLAKEIGEERVAEMAEAFLATRNRSSDQRFTTPPRIRRIHNVQDPTVNPLRPFSSLGNVSSVSPRVKYTPPYSPKSLVMYSSFKEPIVLPTFEEYSAMSPSHKFKWECLTCGAPAIESSTFPGKFCSSRCYDPFLEEATIQYRNWRESSSK